MNGMDWNDLRLFLAVARAGGLAAAAATTGLSAPTLGRRMLALEQALGRTLFERGAAGYRLAVDGEWLLHRLGGMETVARSLELWRQDVGGLPIVSLAADTWTLRLVVADLAELWSPRESFRICLKANDAGVDIARREATVGLYVDRPATGNVAIHRSEPRAYAVYCARNLDADTADWISLGTDVVAAPWTRWVIDHPGRLIRAWVEAPRTLFDICRAGAGKTVLPCFVGDAEPGLKRVGAVLEELTHETWIVSHDDDRHRGEVRTVLDRLHAALARRRAAFLGERAPAPARSDAGAG